MRTTFVKPGWGKSSPLAASRGRVNVCSKQSPRHTDGSLRPVRVTTSTTRRWSPRSPRWKNCPRPRRPRRSRRLAALKALRVAEDAQIGLSGDLAGRSVPVEVSKALGVATMTARTRVENAATAVESHPRLLELVGTGRVSMAGLNRVIETTRVLEPAQQRRVDELVCAEARRRRMTPGELAKAADRRVLEIDPDAAAKRAARARATRDVRLSDPWQGTATVWASLRAEEALAIYTRIDRTSRGMRAAGDPRPLNTLRADLVCELLLGKAAITPTEQPAEQTDQPTDQPTEPADQADQAAPAEDTSAVPDWRSTNGLEPWVASKPPPAAAVTDPDPAPEQECWDSYPDTHTPVAPDPDSDPEPESADSPSRPAGAGERGGAGRGVVGDLARSGPRTRPAPRLRRDRRRHPHRHRHHRAEHRGDHQPAPVVLRPDRRPAGADGLHRKAVHRHAAPVHHLARPHRPAHRRHHRRHRPHPRPPPPRTHRRAQRPRPVQAQPHPQGPPQSPHQSPPGPALGRRHRPPPAQRPRHRLDPAQQHHPHQPATTGPRPGLRPHRPHSSTPNGSPGCATCRTSRRHHTPTTRSTPSPPSSPDSATPADRHPSPSRLGEPANSPRRGPRGRTR